MRFVIKGWHDDDVIIKGWHDADGRNGRPRTIAPRILIPIKLGDFSSFNFKFKLNDFSCLSTFYRFKTKIKSCLLFDSVNELKIF